MAIRRDEDALRQIHTLFHAGTVAGLTDGQLLERFATGGGEAVELAFSALVERHGPVVWRVCRAVLRDEHEAEDAFQATFLVLARKAGSLWVRDSLGPWLHQVAYRAACCARAAASRRKAHERRAGEMAPRYTAHEADRDDLSAAIHEEIERLPRRYRNPLVLCDLEGRTHEDAARSLGCPVGTIKSRLARGRDLLRSRLSRRGVAAPAALLAASATADAAVPRGLLNATVRGAMAVAAGRAPAAGLVSAGVARLVKMILGSLLMDKLKLIAASFAIAAFLAGGSVVAGRQIASGDGPDPTKVQQAAADSHDDQKPKADGARSKRESRYLNEVEGQTTILYMLPSGSHVKKGDLICELDSAALRDQLTNTEIKTSQAQADYENARKSMEVAEMALKEYVEGIFPQEVEALEGAIELSKEEWSLAAQMEQTANTQGDAKIRQSMKTQAQIDKLRANNALRTATSKLNVLKKYTMPRRKGELEAEVAKARSTALARAAILNLEENKARKLRYQIEKCKVRAFSDGVLVYANPPSQPGVPYRPLIEEGATVRERQTLFWLILPDSELPKK